VTTVAADTALARGYEALAVGNWSEARTAFEEAVRTAESPEALDGLGRSLWWLRQGREAIVCRERAYSGFRRDGELARAARIALWLSREYALVFGNDAAARGWLARAERLLRCRTRRRARLARPGALGRLARAFTSDDICRGGA
jgi:tetratricopeptide (TPR) repeat protein